MHTIETRLAAVERQLKFQRLIIGGLLIALVALVGYGALPSPRVNVVGREGKVEKPDGSARIADVIQAGKFEVVDKDGNVVARLGHFHRGSGALEIYTREGKVVAVASALRGNGFLNIYRENGKVVFSTGEIGPAK